MPDRKNTSQKLRVVQSDLGKNIRTIRESKSLSQEELGHRIDADQAYVSRLERAQLNPTLESIVEIANALDVTVQELLTS